MSAAHHEVAGRPHGDVIWIFGFGSLIYNPNFPFAERIEGYVKGWRRVFYQGSTDHRGTPDAPGRTVTLIEDRDSITWGAAYRLSGTPEEQQKTLKYLEWREKQYDLRYRSDVFGKESNGQPLVEGALVYIATPDRRKNVNWLGEAPLEDLARQIAHAHGPSGPNSEYLFRLAETTRKMGVDDPELFQLEAAVRAICEFGDVPL